MVKKTTNEELARMIKVGFDTTATKEDLKRFATKEDLQQVKSDLEGKLNKLESKVDRLEAGQRN